MCYSNNLKNDYYLHIVMSIMNIYYFEDVSSLKNSICIVKEIQGNEHYDRLSNRINLSIDEKLKN